MKSTRNSKWKKCFDNLYTRKDIIETENIHENWKTLIYLNEAKKNQKILKALLQTKHRSLDLLKTMKNYKGPGPDGYTSEFSI